jgi:hypothetical protein
LIFSLQRSVEARVSEHFCSEEDRFSSAFMPAPLKGMSGTGEARFRANL